MIFCTLCRMSAPVCVSVLVAYILLLGSKRQVDASGYGCCQERGVCDELDSTCCLMYKWIEDFPLLNDPCPGSCTW